MKKKGGDQDPLPGFDILHPFKSTRLRALRKATTVSHGQIAGEAPVFAETGEVMHVERGGNRGEVLHVWQENDGDADGNGSNLGGRPVVMYEKDFQDLKRKQRKKRRGRNIFGL